MYRQLASFLNRLRFNSVGVFCLLALFGGWVWAAETVTPADDTPVDDAVPWRSLHVGSTPINIAREGRVVFQQGTATISFDATSRLEGAVPGAVEAGGAEDGTVQFCRRWQSNDDAGSCLVEDTLAAREDHLEWTVTISGTEGIWSVPIVTEIHVERDQFPCYWTAWGSGDPQSNADSPWSDPLRPAPLTDRSLFFGGHSHTESAAISLPLVALVDAQGESAVGFAHALGEQIVEMELQTTADGAMRFVRSNRRITAGDRFRYTVMLYPRLTGFRQLLQRFRDRHAAFFAPQGDLTWFVAGHGAYSEWEGLLADYELHREGFRFNWKASYDYVYMGMFLAGHDAADRADRARAGQGALLQSALPARRSL